METLLRETLRNFQLNPDYFALLPEIIIAVLALTALVIEPFLKKDSHQIMMHLAWLTLTAAAIAVYYVWRSHPGLPSLQFGETYRIDAWSLLFKGVFLLGSFLTVLISSNYIKFLGIREGEFYLLILFATLGMMIMASAGDLIVLFVGLEIMSICLYVLTGILRTSILANEASLKYFLMGAFASGFLIFGIAFVYGACGTTSITGVLSHGNIFSNTYLMIGGILILVGLGFKVGAVPFHMWIPDAYTGAPTSITAFMSAGPKVAAFAALFQVFFVALRPLKPEIEVILWIISALTMCVGNILAISQKDIKRMLAYSSIAHAGYVLIALVAYTPEALAAALYYLLCYTLMNIGAFIVIIMVEAREKSDTYFSSFAGLGRKYPGLGVILTIFMISLAGFPPTAGFMGKFLVFKAAVDTGSLPLLALVILAVINSLISVYYYLGIVVAMFMTEPQLQYRPVSVSAGKVIALAITLGGTLALGFLPQFFAPFLNTTLPAL